MQLSVTNIIYKMEVNQVNNNASPWRFQRLPFFGIHSAVMGVLHTVCGPDIKADWSKHLTDRHTDRIT